MATAQNPPPEGSVPQGPQVEPYALHVSSRYLDLTRRKLELTRLPRVAVAPAQQQWALGTPKDMVSALIDYWLESYDWRTQEARLNAVASQFRTAVTHPPPASGLSEDAAGNDPRGPNVDVEASAGEGSEQETLRVHFLHQRSEAPRAIPLLYAHGWPGSIFEVTRCLEALVNPVDTPTQRSRDVMAFHVVAPSIPGFGFSDPSSRVDFGARAAADIFVGVMEQLGYKRFAVWGDGWGFRVARMLAVHHPSRIIGVYTGHPSDLPAPQALKHKDTWLKYHIAKLTGLRIPWLRFGYTADDFGMPDLRLGGHSPEPTGGVSELDSKSVPAQQKRGEDIEMAETGLTGSTTHPGKSTGESAEPDVGHFTPGTVTSRPQTLSYGFCDSPVGLLALILDALKPTLSFPTPSSSPMGGPSSTRPALGRYRSSTVIERAPPQPTIRDLTSVFSATDILNWTMMYWLPGPEASLRWLLSAEKEDAYAEYSDVPLAITWFANNTNAPMSPRTAAERPAPNEGGPSAASSSSAAVGSGSVVNSSSGNMSPIWASAVQNLRWVKRRAETLQCGIPAWERATEVITDIREFFGVLSDDGTSTA